MGPSSDGGTLRNMVSFIVLAGIAATAVACTLAVSLFPLTGWTTEFWLPWRQRVLADGLAVITITPDVCRPISWRAAQAWAVLCRAWSPYDRAARCGHPGVGLGVSGARESVLLLAPLPLLLWASVRLGPGGLSLSLLIFAGVTLVNGYLGRGPFAIQSSAENVLSLQIFLIAISIPLMLLAALVEERRRAEESLKETEARMAFAAASTDTGLWQYDIPSRYLWATEHCRSMFGLDADSLLTPEALLGLVHPGDREVAIAAMRAAATSAGERAGRSEFRVVHPNGQLRWYLATASTEFDKNGEPTRVSGVFRDVTARKKAEQEAKQLEDALRAARRELAQVSRQTTVGAMAASIAPEINQPLSALVTNGGIGLRLLAKADSDLDEVREVFRRIIDDGHRASQVVSSVRAMFGKDRRKKPR